LPTAPRGARPARARGFRARARTLTRPRARARPAARRAPPRSLVALEAALAAVQTAGPALLAHARLVGVLRARVCTAAGVAAGADGGADLHALSLSLRLFAYCVSAHRRVLRAPIGTYWQSVLLASEPAGGARLELLLEGLGALLRLEGLVGYLWAHYDCALQGANVFEATLTHLCTHVSAPAALTAPCALALDALVELIAPLVPADLRGAEGDGGAEGAEGGGEEAGGAGALPGRAAPAAPAAAAALRERRERKRLLALAADHFNCAPAKGLALLRARGLLDAGAGAAAQAEVVAAFLHAAPSLDKGAVGDYLGEPAAAVDGTLAAYLRRAGLGGRSLLGALRRFLGLFRLPGEAQKISRILEAFAAEHARAGSDLGQFGSADGVFVLAYSLIMLNTDLHNPAVKKKMSADDFVRANRAINDGADFPSDFLRGLYAEIRSDEIRLAHKQPYATGGPAHAHASANAREHLTADGAAELGADGAAAGAVGSDVDADDDDDGGGGGGGCDGRAAAGAPAAAEPAAALSRVSSLLEPASDAPSRAAKDARLTRAHGSDMLALVLNRGGPFALVVALRAAAEPPAIALALRGLRLLAVGAAHYGLFEQLDSVLTSLCIQTSEQLLLAPTTAAPPTAAAPPAAPREPPTPSRLGGEAGGAQAAAGSPGGGYSPDGRAAAGVPAEPAGVCKLARMVYGCLFVSRECGHALRESWLDLLELALCLRELAVERPALAAAAGVRIVAPPLSALPRDEADDAAGAAAARPPSRAADAAADADGAGAGLSVPAVCVSELLQLEQASRWAPAAQLALMRALQSALHRACEQPHRDPDQLSARACLECMATLYVGCALDAAEADEPHALALWAPVGEVLAALANPQSALAADAPLARHTVVTSLRLFAACRDGRAGPAGAQPLSALLALSPAQLASHGLPVARALAAHLAAGAADGAPPSADGAPPCADLPPSTDLLALLQTLAAVPDERIAAAVAAALASAVERCARAPERSAVALAQCATTAVTAARAGLARPAALLAPLQAAHAALVPVQGMGTDALRALCAIALERADAHGRERADGRAGAPAARAAEMVSRAACALTQLLLLAGAPTTAPHDTRSVWLHALGALCACVDALRGGGGGGSALDEREVVEQGVLNLLLCAAHALDSDLRARALALVRESKCAPDTVEAIAAVLGVESAGPAGPSANI
jgi:hypothetical protein